MWSAAMTRAELLALAARVEAATGADRELDRRIDHIRWPVPQPAYHLELSLRDRWDVPAFTSSIDAAASLVPATASTWRLDPRCASICVGRVRWKHGMAATPALALTAAALRAMAEEAPNA
jgi:hypothetical protein